MGDESNQPQSDRPEHELVDAAPAPPCEPPASSPSTGGVGAGGGGGVAVGGAGSGTFGRALGGDLKCIVCGYNLKGISIRGRCPECGVRIRATILAVVDPMANELRAIPRRRLVAAGLVVWAVSAFAVAMLSWLPQIADALSLTGLVRWRRPDVGIPIFVFALTGALGALGICRPHAGVQWRATVACMCAAVLFTPLAWMLLEVHTLADAGKGWRYLHGWSPTRSDALLGAGTCALLAAGLLLMRPVVRVLVARSLLMRTGRVDRQTLYAIAGAACIIAVGHGLGYWSTLGVGAGGWGSGMRAVLRSLGLALVAFGSLLLTIGFGGALVDAVRIAGAVLLPSPALGTVVRYGHDPGSAIMAMVPRSDKSKSASRREGSGADRGSSAGGSGPSGSGAGDRGAGGAG